MSQAKFFQSARQIFGGRLTQSQVDGINRIISYRDSHYPQMDDDKLAYVLATTFWETGRKMTPVVEGGGPKYLNSKPYSPYYGRGLCQLTWKNNYLRYNCADHPDKALEWDTALHVIFDGMCKGIFTGKKLSDYINGSGCNYVQARRIINGTDKAQVIASLAIKWRAALHDWVPAKPEVTGSPALPPPPRSVAGRVADVLKNVFSETEGAVSNAPMPPPVHGSLTGAKAYTLSAIVAAIGALQLIDWQEVVEHPEVGYGLILSAVGTAVTRAVLPVWLQRVVLK